MMAAINHVGVVDWGIGGLDLHHQLTRAHPALTTTYVSDAGFTPYGKLSEQALVERLQTILNFLVDTGVDAIVVACNAASSILPRLQSQCTLPITGVIAPTLEALLRMPPTTVGILGGTRTIKSRAYEAPLTAAGFTVRTAIAQPLSALVEAGQLRGPEVQNAVRRVSTRLGQVHALVPACTHYMAIMSSIQPILKPNNVIDPTAETMNWIGQYWSLPTCANRPIPAASTRYVTSGEPDAMRQAAQRAFGLHVPQVERRADLTSVRPSNGYSSENV